MAEKIRINGVEIRQPDEGLGYDFETTFSSDTTRTQDGVLHSTPLFTVEALLYSASFVKLSEMKRILSFISKGEPFTLHYFSACYGKWRDDEFYVGKGSLSISRLIADKEVFEGLSFRMTGVNPILYD